MAAPPHRSVYVETYGCQMNVLDSELVCCQLESAGYQIVDEADEADIVLLNTCSVRDLAEHKVWSRLGRLAVVKREEGRPDLVVGVIGCMAEREARSIRRRAPHVDLVCGASMLDRLPLLLENLRHNREFQLALAGHAQRGGETEAKGSDELEPLDSARSFSRSASSQAYVRITRGCNKFCSFCVVPFTRGPEVHRPPDRIVEETRKLVDAGVIEVTLLGQTVNHYGHKEGGKTTSFADLLWQVHEEVPELPRLRFVTSYPRDFNDATLDVMANANRICRYLHLPAQSGSNRMLQAMNRGHTVETYLALLERARERLPDVCLAGDMIVGFPGETPADHQASLELVEAAQYKSCFVFKYSARPGTVAHRRLRDDIPEDVKKERNLEILDLQAQISLSHNRQRVGRRLEVLVEGHSKLRAHAHPDRIQIDGTPPSSGMVRLVGRTRGDEIVAFDGDPSLTGTIVWVRAVDATPLTILATTDNAGENG
ncbi:tRNA (N6-isopentenyl adenosine(37)-C2)-methylthiotransferase MiaB [Myxococcota bacterium]